MSTLAEALLAELDAEALDVLAAKLAPALARRLAEMAPAEDRWMNSREAAHYLAITPAALYRLTASRRIPFEQSVAGGKCWFQRARLDEWRTRGG